MSDGIITYHDWSFRLSRGVGPETEPALYTDIAPFKIWLITPGWRAARLSDIQSSYYPLVIEDIKSIFRNGHTLELYWESQEIYASWTAGNEQFILWHALTEVKSVEQMQQEGK